MIEEFRYAVLKVDEWGCGNNGNNNDNDGRLMV